MTYKTKQSREILSCLDYYRGTHVNVPMISRYLEDQGHPVSVATIYRHLEKLEKDGLVRKFIVDGKAGACFQYVGEAAEHCCHHYHLKCEKCGRLIHLECETLDSLGEHMRKDHGFAVNSMKTVFYGICENCAEEK